jgi:anti-anti-sigma regulatory factor
MPSGSRKARSVGVDRLQPGDHAILTYSDDEERWEILSIFTQQGFARGERVCILIDVNQSPGEIAPRVAGGTAAARGAIGSGQLVVSNTPRFTRGGYDPTVLVDRTRERIAATLREGYRGLRSASDTSLALTPVDDWHQFLEYETIVQETLFATGQARWYTAICQYDLRRFGDIPVMDAIREVHPVTVLDQTGALHVSVTVGGLRIAGEVDLSTRAEFTDAMRRLARLEGLTLLLDITDLSFLDAYSAGSIMRLAAGLTGPRRLEVRCRNHQRRLLHTLGSRSVRQLSIVTERL